MMRFSAVIFLVVLVLGPGCRPVPDAAIGDGRGDTTNMPHYQNRDIRK